MPNVVLDPILKSSSGAELLDAAGTRLLIEKLIPLADVVTPNVDEAALLTGLKVTDLDEMRAAAAKFHEMGSAAVVITGGHSGESNRSVELHRQEWNRGGSLQGGAATFELHSRHRLRLRDSHRLPPGARPRIG